MKHMKTYTLTDANAYLDKLAANLDCAGDAMALRSLVNDGVSADEIAFMMRGNFPLGLITVLVEAHHSTKAEPVIAA
jgi:hypothetical protein